MKITKIALASIALACFSSLSASAKNEVKTAYIFGFASSFNDSTVYFTDVQKVDSAYFTRKNKFLISRENYSYQLRDYLEQKGAGNRTCIVMFDFNQKKAEKKWNKLYARYIQKPKAKKAKNGQQMNDAPSPYQVKTINSTDFHFSSVQPNDEEVEEVKVKKAKKAKKEKRRTLQSKKVNNKFRSHSLSAGNGFTFLYHIIFYFRFCLNQFAIWRSRWLRVLPPEMP